MWDILSLKVRFMGTPGGDVPPPPQQSPHSFFCTFSPLFSVIFFWFYSCKHLLQRPAGCHTASFLLHVLLPFCLILLLFVWILLNSLVFFSFSHNLGCSFGFSFFPLFSSNKYSICSFLLIANVSSQDRLNLNRRMWLSPRFGEYVQVQKWKRQR